MKIISQAEIIVELLKNVYTSKFILIVVSLKHIDLATDEDKQFVIDQ
jgi:hypothetical protein